MKKYIGAIDIGYSNLKVRHGIEGGKINNLSVPATAMLKDEVGMEFGFSKVKDSVVNVLVNDEQWCVGVSPFLLGKGKRQLNRDYCDSSEYKAMYHAALSEMETDVVDYIVTGLPVDQALNENYAKKLKTLLEGEHKVNRKRTVTVKNVLVIPQPTGAFVDFAENEDDQDVVEHGSVLFIDPGFYSVDHVLIQRGQLNEGCSNTSLHAMSRILDKCGEYISADYGSIEAETIEDAIQNGRPKILVKGNQVEFKEYLEKAAYEVSIEALTFVKSSLRSVKNIDAAVLVGGGGSLFEKAAKEILTNCGSFRVAKEAHFAIVRGYFSAAVSMIALDSRPETHAEACAG